MARGRARAKIIIETALEKASRLDRERDLADQARVPLVNDFARQHGDYGRDSDKSDKRGKSTTMRNRHVTTIERWIDKGLLSETQRNGTAYCLVLWSKLRTSKAITMNWDSVGGQVWYSGIPEQEALDELGKLQALIPVTYWAVFELVCRFDEPGGVAGSRWANDDGRASQSALMCVRFVADSVAMWRRL